MCEQCKALTAELAEEKAEHRSTLSLLSRERDEINRLESRLAAYEKALKALAYDGWHASAVREIAREALKEAANGH